jgi:hypothetical protein
MRSRSLLIDTMQPHTMQSPAAQPQTMQSSITQPAQRYDPDHLLATLIERLNLKNDAALSRALEVSPPVISKIRHRRLPVTASLLIRMHEVSTLSIKELRLLMGDRRQKFRISDKHFKPKSVS